MNKIVQVENLRKSYKNQEILKGIDFDIYEGEIFAMLGPNGAGKSTTMNILSTNSRPSSGCVRIDDLILGEDNYDIKKRIGIVFQDGVLDDTLTVGENLLVRGKLYGLKGTELNERILKLSQTTGISNLLNKDYGKLSGGQRRRCDIARALLHFPKLLFLDEPTTGLDPEMRTAVWETINSIRSHSNMTILLTTHYMEEATLADRIMFLKNGRVAALGTPTELKTNLTHDSLLIYTKNLTAIENLLKICNAKYSYENGIIKIPLNTTANAIPILETCKGNFSSFEVLRGNLEDAYISIIEGDTKGVYPTSTQYDTLFQG